MTRREQRDFICDQVALTPTSTMGCPHVLAILADAQAKEAIVEKYTSVVTWNLHRTHDAMQSPTKRRKVRAMIVAGGVFQTYMDIRYLVQCVIHVGRCFCGPLCVCTAHMLGVGEMVML
jgi:hypothetical protein